MGNYTTNLSLYNTDMTTDGNDTFDFQRDLNDNNNKIDSAVGKLSNLTTTQKGSLVGAINEIDSDLDGKASKDLDNLSATGQAIIDGKVSSADLYDENQLIKINKLQSYSLPSSNYDDLTLGALGSIYTAPADGWFVIDVLNTNNTYIFGANIKSYRGNAPWDYEGRVVAYSQYATIQNQAIGFIIPAMKNDGVVITYNGSPTIRIFRFIYANGAQQS